MTTLCLILCWPICRRQMRVMRYLSGEPYGVIARRLVREALRLAWEDWAK